jgi:hypothetical protein
MWRAGNLPESSACPSAIDAYHKSKIISFMSQEKLKMGRSIDAKEAISRCN